MDREPGLVGRRVLVVEDEFLIALDVEDALRELGCEVLGPVSTVAEAVALAVPAACDLAVLDVRLVDGSTAPLAIALQSRDIPFLVPSAPLRAPRPVVAPLPPRPFLARLGRR